MPAAAHNRNDDYSAFLYISVMLDPRRMQVLREVAQLFALIERLAGRERVRRGHVPLPIDRFAREAHRLHGIQRVPRPVA